MTSTGVTIRPAVTGDAEILANLNSALHELHRVAHPDIFKAVDRAEVISWFRASLLDANTRIWVAEADGAVRGYVYVLVCDRPDNPFCFERRWFEIDQIAVLPGWRHKGIGRRLVSEVLSAAAKDGVVTVELNSWMFNETAHIAFKTLGFTPTRMHFGMRALP